MLRIADYLGLPKITVTVVYVTFAAAIVIAEEVAMARETYIETRKMQEMTNVLKGSDADGNHIKFEDLTEAEQRALQSFYDSVDERNERRMTMMARESSIQLIYQKALLLYQFVNPPLVELDFTHGGINEINPTTPSALWISGLVLQIVSILTSANSTFSPIIQYTKYMSYKNNKTPAGLFTHLTQAIQVLIHMVFATGVVYLLEVYKIYRAHCLNLAYLRPLFRLYHF